MMYNLKENTSMVGKKKAPPCYHTLDKKSLNMDTALYYSN